MTTETEQPVVVLSGGRLAYTLDQLADATPFSKDTLRRAIRKAKDDDVFPHPLPAHRDSRGRAVVLVADAQAWLAALPDY